MAIRHLLPKRPAWLLATIGGSLGAIAVVAAVVWRGRWMQDGTPSLVLGAIAALIVLIDALYPIRRRLTLWPLTTAERWLQFHVYGGSLACVLAILHVGFEWPTGRLGWLLLVTGLWSVTSGAVGVFLQKHLPAVLATELSVETTYERLPQLAARLQVEADQLIDGSPEMVQRVYRAEIRPSLAAVQPSWFHLVEAGMPARRLAALRGLQAFVNAAEQDRLEQLVAIVHEKHQLDVQYSLQRVLRQWLVLHVPATYLFAGLLLLHVVLALSF